MSHATRPHRRLPARVYWFRRGLVLAFALGLVFGVAHLLGAGSGDPQRASAQPVGAAAGSPSAAPSPTDGALATSAPGKHHGKRQTPTPTPLAVPTGPCDASDVVVTPTVQGDVYAGSAVPFTLELTTVTSPACNWTVSPQTLVVRVSSGSDRIWSTQDCKGAVGKQEVVVRKDVPTSVRVSWQGQRSDGTCSRTTPWAQPGYYHVAAAALGAEPAEAQFVLREPVAPTIVASPTESPSEEGDGHGRSEQNRGRGHHASPSQAPTKTD